MVASRTAKFFHEISHRKFPRNDAWVVALTTLTYTRTAGGRAAPNDYAFSELISL